MNSATVPAVAPAELLAGVWPWIRKYSRQVAARFGLDADDLAQNVAVRVLRNGGSYDPAKAKPTTWVNRVIVNMAVNELRRWTPAVAGTSDCLHGLPARPSDHDQAAEGRRAAVARLLATVPAADRKVLIRRFGLDGGPELAGSALARHFGVTRAMTSLRLRRALTRLRAEPNLRRSAAA